MEKMGSIFSQWITPETEQVYFITGKTFSNLPLHLMKTANGQFLIEQLTVCYVSSLFAMAQLYSGNQEHTTALISYVTKENEEKGYKLNAKKCASVIEKYFTSQKYPAKLLAQENATIETVTAALEEATEAVFICHGNSFWEVQKLLHSLL